jgi:glycosyltransferase involved in cell wall biosynthesis
MTLHLISAYGPSGASTRVRLLDWADHLDLAAEVHGYRGTPSNRPADLVRDPAGVRAAESSLRALDTRGSVVVLSREASPLSSGRLEARLLGAAARAAYDIDDAVFLPTGLRRGPLSAAGKARRAARAADVVIAGNDYLADWATDHCRDVRVIPSCVEPAHYHRRAARGEGPPRLVWLGSASTEVYLTRIIEPLLYAHQRFGARLVVISGPRDNPALAALGPMLERVPWRLQTFAQELSRGDVGLAPLPDNPWARGKCAYKLLQYAATALPVIGDPVGANDLALRRLHGWAAGSRDAWVDALTVALSSPEEVESRGAAARVAVSEHYSFAAWSPAWRDATAA